MIAERDIEAYLVRLAERTGGHAYKFTSPGCIGVPDRLILLPKGVAFFVELKAPGQRPRPIQEKRGKELAALGFPVLWLDSKEAVKGLMDAAVNGSLEAEWRKWE